MSILLQLFPFSCCLALLLLVESTISLEIVSCQKLPCGTNVSIGVVIDESSRVGKEQKIAMKLAVQDFRHCVNLLLHMKDSRGNSARAVSAAIDLLRHEHVETIIGTLTLEQASSLSHLKPVPIISLSSPQQPPPAPPANFIQMTTPLTHHTQCIAAVVGHFRWKKVILLHEQGSTPSSLLFTSLSDALHAVDSSIELHISLPRVSSLSHPAAFIERELKQLMDNNVRIFVVVQSSLEFGMILFEKAKVFGMMETGYVWIVSDEIADLLDSVDSSVIRSMQGVLGLKLDYSESEDLRAFKSRFRRKYLSSYTMDEEDINPRPSIYALRAYDAISTVAKSVNCTEFEGLSGRISFEDGFLSQKPVFDIVNVIGRSYREVTLWSKGTKLNEDDMKLIYWPGGQQTVPKGWSVGSRDKPLKIGVPARGAFNQFVKVTYDSVKNKSLITGFSIDVFEAAVKKLPYDLYYEFVPCPGSYDDMVAEVYNKSLDAAVGDTEIMADRYVYAEFSQPYIESGLVMVVTVKPGVKESKFIALSPFTKKMWIQLAVVSIATGFVVWLSEFATGNEQFTRNSILENIGSILWLSVTIISFSQRENINTTTSRLVLAVWGCVVFVIGASFTAVLSSMMTVPRLEPSIQEIDFLRNSNAVVGCNGNSFICRYLENVLNFEPNNVKRINHISEYPQAFQSGEIKAAFFVAPHAKIFLAEYCNGYTISGPSFKLGGFGFVFQKGSPLAIDISEALLRVTQSGHVDILEQDMLHHLSCNSSEHKADNIQLGPGPFSGLFLVLGCILAFAFIDAMARLMSRRWSSMLRRMMSTNIRYMWASTRFWSMVFREEMNASSSLAEMAPNSMTTQS